MDTLTLSPKTDKKSVQFNNTLSISKGTKLGKRFKLEGTLRLSSKDSFATELATTSNTDGKNNGNDKLQKGSSTENRHLTRVSCADSAYSSMSSLASPSTNSDRLSSSTMSSKSLQTQGNSSIIKPSDSAHPTTYQSEFRSSLEHPRSNSFDQAPKKSTLRDRKNVETCTKADVETLKISRQLSPRTKFKNHRSSIKLTLTEPMRRRADSISFSSSYDSDQGFNPSQKKMMRQIQIFKDSDQGFGFSITTIGLRDKDGNMRHRTFVTDVDSHGPAKRCGLFPGDEILAINGVDTDEINHYEIIKQVKYSKFAKSSNVCTVKVAFVDGLRYIELHMKCNKKLNKLFKKQEELKALKNKENDILKTTGLLLPENNKSDNEVEDKVNYLNMLCTSVAAAFPTVMDNAKTPDPTDD